MIHTQVSENGQEYGKQTSVNIKCEYNSNVSSIVQNIIKLKCNSELCMDIYNNF